MGLIEQAHDILDKWQCFQGQRAGRELWAHKPKDVQDQDIADFNRDVEIVRSALEAEPVRHGRWIKTDNGIRININTGEPFRAYLHDCSACGWHTGNQGSRFNYCPNCGAKMDGDKHDTEG